MLKNKLNLMGLLGVMTLSSCADFVETFENVIPDKKIRSYTIKLTPAEAMPGDTVRVDLKLHDANKSYELDWELTLAYDIEDYGYLNQSNYVVNLDSMALNAVQDAYGNKVSFDFVVPKGESNPMLLSSLIPETLLRGSELNDTYKSEFESYGINLVKGELLKKEFCAWADSQEVLPMELSPWIHNQVSLMRLQAQVKSDDFRLDVNKTLSVKYTRKMPNSDEFENKNTEISKFNLWVVHAQGVEDYEKIQNHHVDTISLTSFRNGNGSEPWIDMDSITVNSDYSYFLEALGGESAQNYFSPKGEAHSETVFNTWFFSNLDATDSDYDSQFKFGEADLSLGVVPVIWPKNTEIHKVQVSLVRTDWRPEWANLHSRGVAFGQVGFYLK